MKRRVGLFAFPDGSALFKEGARAFAGIFTREDDGGGRIRGLPQLFLSAVIGRAGDFQALSHGKRRIHTDLLGERMGLAHHFG